MTAQTQEKLFVERMQELLVHLPYDMKVLFEALSDENLPREARMVAAGAAIYCLSPSDPIPDSAGILGFVDDVVVVRLALARLLELAHEDAAAYPERFPEQFDGLDRDLELVRGYLGESMAWLEDRVKTRVPHRRYKGKSPAEYVEDDEALEFLYAEGQAFATAYDIDEAEAARLRRGDQVREVFAARARVEARRAQEG